MALVHAISEMFVSRSQSRSRQLQEVIAKGLTPSLAGRPLPAPNDFRAFAEEGYRKNVIIYACINIIARTAAPGPDGSSGPILTVASPNSDGELEPIAPGRGDGPGRALQELLDRPNPEQSQFDWIERLLIEFGYSGNSFTQQVGTRGGRAATNGPVAELWQLAPYRVEIIPERNGVVKGYKFPKDEPGLAKMLAAEDVMHMKRPDPLDEFYGLSPIAVAARSGDLDNLATDYLREMFNNLGEPSAFLVFKEIMNRAQHERQRTLWQDTYGGKKGWHRIGTLDSAVDWKEVGSRPDQMALEGVFSHSESRLCMAWGIPPILVGAWLGLLRGTYSNYEQALRDFWTDTVTPMYVRLGGTLTHGLAHRFADDLVIFFDLSKVAALQEDKEKLREFALSAWRDSLLPRNRCLDMVGETPIDGPRGDAYSIDEKPAPGVGGIGLMLASPQAVAQLAPGDQLALPPGEILKQPPKVWVEIQSEADKAAPDLATSFSRAVARAQDAVSLLSLEQALKNRDIRLAESILVRAWTDQQADLGEDMTEPLTKIFREGAKIGEGDLKSRTVSLLHGPSENLQVSDLEAEEFVRSRVADLVVEVSEGTKLAIRKAIDSLSEGESFREAAKQIQQQVGLTSRWIDSLEKKREQGASASAIARLARKLVRRRAVFIGINEARRAASEGQEFVWARALTNGILNPNTVQFWITQGPEACPICQPMEGQERPIGEPFLTGDNRLVRLPPEPHPGCLCARGLRTKNT